MPRYFFDLKNDVDARDEEGRELPDLDAVRSHAIIEAREIAKESVDDGHLNLDHRIEVRDESGTIVCVVRFGEAVEIVPRKPS